MKTASPSAALATLACLTALLFASGCASDDGSAAYLAALNEEVSAHNANISYICRCQYWALGLPDESSCNRTYQLGTEDRNTLQQCVGQALDDVSSANVDVSAVAACYRSTVAEYQRCINETPQVCSEANLDRILFCEEVYDSRSAACYQLHLTPMQGWMLDNAVTDRCSGVF